MSKTKSATTLELVALGGSIQERRRGREAVTQSEVAIRLNSDAAVEKCLRGLDLSDQRLADVPQMYDWVMVWKETEKGKPGATVRFGVAWYDEAYFQEKKDIYLGADHLAMFAGFGAGSADVEVKHYVLAA
ncbi:hypothetical protein OOZ51_20355 [Arthrobacter sp. MI7-26]|uniref:hypothetical protein n=1 Tax=Arthrobacter sp. MI7-26 TaxID=2993653 RepID=UPI0022488EDA|nr:hypothetical protein [Arthrobacter sp. MI7-26]MCX2750138.1 hypothetical protein [Arthrobacter sp. MI7-26]